MKIWLRIAVGVGLVPLLLTTGIAAAGFPPAMEKFIASVLPLTAAERQALLSGAPISKVIPDADPSKEVAIFGAVWMAGTPSDYVRWVKDIEHFESGGALRITKRISDPPSSKTSIGLIFPMKISRICEIARSATAI